MEIALAGAASDELCQLIGNGAVPYPALNCTPRLSWDLLALCHGCAVSGAVGLTASCLLLPGDSEPRLTRMIPARQLVSYGFSPRDTLTLSSFGSPDRMLCLQRSVIAPDGTLLEPQELPLPSSLSALGDESALLAGGVLLLCMPRRN